LIARSLAVLSALTLAACGGAKQRALPACELNESDAGDTVGVASDPVLIAAGDIAECGGDGAERTAKLLDRLEGTIAPLGDNAYESGTLDEYLDCYDPSWGRHRARTRPTVGNHEYRTPNAGAYFAYFCGMAGEPFKGWYSYELGSWHVIVLNSNCKEVGGCGAGSEQEAWLRADLAAHPAKCTAAYWHHPRFSSGEHGDDNEMSTLWNDLYEAGAEVVLAGHEHDYERFAPLNAAGALDEARGIRSFIVGTGGRGPRNFKTIKTNSLARHAGILGVLSLTLHDGSYDWQFIREDGHAADTGRGECH